MKRVRPTQNLTCASPRSCYQHCTHYDAGCYRKPSLAQLVKRLTEEVCSNQMVPASLPDRRTDVMPGICFGPLVLLLQQGYKRQDLDRRQALGILSGQAKVACRDCKAKMRPHVSESCGLPELQNGKAECTRCSEQ